MKPAITVMPRASMVGVPWAFAAAPRHRRDSPVAHHDGALVDHLAVADDDPGVGDHQILSVDVVCGNEVDQRKKDSSCDSLHSREPTSFRWVPGDTCCRCACHHPVHRGTGSTHWSVFRLHVTGGIPNPCATQKQEMPGVLRRQARDRSRAIDPLTRRVSGARRGPPRQSGS